MKEYRVCYHHVSNPTYRINYPLDGSLLTRAEAEQRAEAERKKGYMIAWVTGPHRP